MSQNELYHYGIPGMRWGKRKSVSSNSSAKSERKMARAEDKAIKKDMRKAVKNRRKLSDEELTARIGRLEKQKKLRDLTNEEINGGKKATKDILKSAGTKAITTIASGAALYGVKAILEKEFDPKDLAGYLAPKPKSK